MLSAAVPACRRRSLRDSSARHLCRPPLPVPPAHADNKLDGAPMPSDASILLTSPARASRRRLRTLTLADVWAVILEEAEEEYSHDDSSASMSSRR